MPTMNVSLTNELARFVEDEVKEGQYRLGQRGRARRAARAFAGQG